MTSINSANPIKENKSLKSRIKKNVSENKIVFVCIIALMFIFLWAKIKISNVEKLYLAEKEKVAIDFQNSVDSLNEVHIKQVTTVLSWAVRRNLVLDNLEEINILFLSFIKESNVDKIQLIDPRNSTVLISTDKNEEGQNVVAPNILNIVSVGILEPSTNLTKIVVAPIMGLNQKEGVLVVHYNYKTLYHDKN